MNCHNLPLQSLIQGRWFKLICGASFQHVPSVRSSVVAYGLEGADCIDVAAEPAVVAAAKEGLDACERLTTGGSKPQRDRHTQLPRGDRWQRPWLMVSVNDGEDPHFRTARFDPSRCPGDCPRPCERVCPTGAISAIGGVTEPLCYGCGRCLSVCPHGYIDAVTYQRSPQDLPALVLDLGVDALEIHTHVGHYKQFQTLWRSVRPYLPNLKLVAVSCPRHLEAIAYLHDLWDWVASDVQRAGCAWLWQADGKPMSGDLGQKATDPAIAYGEELLQTDLPGFIQLAGGTNQTTADKLRQQELIGKIAGVAYGGYARSQLKPILEQLEQREQQCKQTLTLESQGDLLNQGRAIARNLIAPLKGSVSFPTAHLASTPPVPPKNV
ncbi:MAG: LdpA C-terminal domain-containing domain [Cyanobacteria bacterium P01_D01_bin.73]